MTTTGTTTTGTSPGTSPPTTTPPTVTIDPTKAPVSNFATQQAVDVSLASGTSTKSGTALNFSLTVTDTLGNQASATTTVIVEGPPTVQIAAQSPVGAGQPIQLSATVTPSYTGQSIKTYAWSLTSAKIPG